MKFVEKDSHITLEDYKLINKFPYKQYSRAEDPETGKRMYSVDGTKLPSVTTILGATKDQTSLDAWKKRVGEEQANKIKNEAATIGTEMHLVIEKYIQGEGYLNLSETGNKARKMAHTILKQLDGISEVWGNEISLAYSEKYAGATDLVAVYKDKPMIFDWKQTNKKKEERWIEDYYLQLAAYTLAHENMYGKLEGGKICMCSRNYEYQEFTLEGEKLKEYQEKWWERYQKYLSTMSENYSESSSSSSSSSQESSS
jgi:hypothetical protein